VQKKAVAATLADLAQAPAMLLCRAEIDLARILDRQNMTPGASLRRHTPPTVDQRFQRHPPVRHEAPKTNDIPARPPTPAGAGTRSPATPSAPADGPPFFQPPVSEQPQSTAQHRDGLLYPPLTESAYPAFRYLNLCIP